MMKQSRAVVAGLTLGLAACAGRSVTPPLASAGPSGSTAAVDAQFAAARLDTAALLALIRALPKGGDLHSHLSGAIYAESFARWAGEDGLCYAVTTATLLVPPCPESGDTVPAARLLTDTLLARAAVDAWSMRGWRRGETSGHDHFFATFGRFGLATRGRTGDMLAEVMARAGAQRIRYLELMETLDHGISNRIARRVGWTDDLAEMQRRLERAGLRDSLRLVPVELDSAEARERRILRCGSAAEDPGCRVVVRYLYQVIRERPPEEVFAQILAGFALAAADRRLVGLNLVAPEDGPTAMRDRALHMRMIDHLYAQQPTMHVTLHAGEVTSELIGSSVPRSHIRDAIVTGHASRIGHGVDVMQERDPPSLLRLMAARGVLVEIALTSNAEILGVAGDRHPLHTYLSHGVPVAFVTDDEGVSRSDMTHELLAAVQQQGMSYTQIRTALRNSLTYAFVEDSVKARLLSELDVALAAFEVSLGARDGAGAVRIR